MCVCDCVSIRFSNGLLDPWSGGGVLKTISKTLVAVVIPNGAHHLDLRSHNAADPASVKAARELEMKHISMWIEQHGTQTTPYDFFFFISMLW